MRSRQVWITIYAYMCILIDISLGMWWACAWLNPCLSSLCVITMNHCLYHGIDALLYFPPSHLHVQLNFQSHFICRPYLSFFYDPYFGTKQLYICLIALSNFMWESWNAFGEERCTLDILAIVLIFSDYVSGTILSHFPLLYWYIKRSIDPCWFAHCHVYSLFNIVFTQALLCLGRAVREKLQRLETQMNVRVKALWGCHGLLFIQDNQKMCSVGWQCLKVINQPRKSLWMQFLITLSRDTRLEPNPLESTKKKNEGDSPPFLFPQLNYFLCSIKTTKKY